MSSERPAFSREFWEAVERGELLVQKCLSCGGLQMYPRRSCVACSASEITYVPVSGQGKIYTFSTVLKYAPSDFAEDVPYTLAVVTLDEGPRMLTRIVDSDPDGLRCDMPVKFAPSEIHGQVLPTFTAA
jgi:uncharacterized OB-fold protein